jgi:hypothetical protein
MMIYTGVLSWTVLDLYSEKLYKAYLGLGLWCLAQILNNISF